MSFVCLELLKLIGNWIKKQWITFIVFASAHWLCRQVFKSFFLTQSTVIQQIHCKQNNKNIDKVSEWVSKSKREQTNGE